MESPNLGQKRIKELFIKAGEALKLINHTKKEEGEGNKREYQRLTFSDVIKDFTLCCPSADSTLLQRKGKKN